MLQLKLKFFLINFKKFINEVLNLILFLIKPQFSLKKGQVLKKSLFVKRYISGEKIMNKVWLKIYPQLLSFSFWLVPIYHRNLKGVMFRV